MAFNSGSLVIRVAVIVPLISLWLLLHPEQSYACSCVTPGSPSEEMATSAAVFMGRVVSVREFEPNDGSWSSIDPTTVEFAVSTVWKGPSYETMFLTTARSGASCGFTFVEDEEYVVYSSNGSGVSLCSRTRSLSEAQHDLTELGKGRAPIPGTIAPTPVPFTPRASTPSQPWAIIGPTVLLVVGLMIGATWLGLRKRRSDRL